MFIPRYWSEATHVERLEGRRQVTLRRFGWASTSQADADVHARQRVGEAATMLRAGGEEALADLVRKERRVAYSGSDGLPIREEIVEERPDLDVVLTRNGYGAVCLNTTRALFVDIDAPASNSFTLGCWAGVLGGVVGWIHSGHVVHVTGILRVAARLGGALLCAFVLAWLVSGITRGVERLASRRRDPTRYTLDRCRAWCDAHPAWRVAVYQTPGGFRALALHAAADAAAPETLAFMRFVHVDPLYERMCTLQRCFRARVSPKPWRVGVTEHFRAGGTWPVTDPGKLAARTAWVERYEVVARDHASCRYLAEVGSGARDPAVADIRRLHDDLCHATRRLELA